jgi:autotransporter-associated beta strand protein
MELQNGANSFTGNVTINSGQVYAEAFGVSGSTSTLGSQAIAGRTITINSTGYLGFLSNDIFGTATSGVANIPSIIINGGQGAVLYSTRYNALGNVTLNGGKLDQQSTDTGNFEGYQFLGTITVGGTSQSTISSLGQRNHLGANTTFNVGSTGISNASVVGDLVVTTPLINQSGNFGLAAGALTKTGAGTMRLTGASTYSGGTTINAGSLLANGVGSGTTSSATGTGVVTVNGSGTTLGGTGAIAGAVTINGGAQITGGSAGTVGTLTLRSNVTFSGTSGNLATFFVDLASGANNSDRLTIGGTLNLGTVFDRIAFSGTADGVSSYTLATYSSLNGTFDSVLNMPNGYELQYTGTDLTLVPVPEPSTWVAALLTAAVLGYSQRRRLAGVLARRPA